MFLYKKILKWRGWIKRTQEEIKEKGKRRQERIKKKERKKEKNTRENSTEIEEKHDLGSEAFSRLL